MPIKILHVFWKMDRGGAEMRTLDVMSRIDREKYRFLFLATSGESGTLDVEIRALGGEVLPCKLGRGFAARFRAVLREHRPDVVHSHLHLTSGYILRYAKRVPLRIAHLRSTGDGRAGSLRRNTQRWLLRRITLRHADRILAVSEGALDSQFTGWRGNAKFQVIYNGVPFDPFATAEASGVRTELGIPDGVPFFIHVGRLESAKNHAKLLAVFDAISKRTPEARLLLVGRNEGPERAVLRQQIDALRGALPSPDNVIWAGERSDVARLLAAADAMIFPSHREGLPGAVIEACLAATPVVASDIPGAQEIEKIMANAGLNMVQTLPVDEPNDSWADAALAMARKKWDIKAVHAAMRGGDFDIETCLAKLHAVWDAARR